MYRKQIVLSISMYEYPSNEIVPCADRWDHCWSLNQYYTSTLFNSHMKTETKSELRTLFGISLAAGIGKVALVIVLYGVVATLRHYLH